MNEVGRQQASDLATHFKEVQFDAIISSPLKRAYETAEIVSMSHDVPVIIKAAWREREIGGHVSLETWNDLFNFDKNIVPEKGEALKDFLIEYIVQLII